MVVNTGEGTLTLTGFNAGTGALSYSYTLNAAQNQPGATESTDTIALTVNDLAGGSNTGNPVSYTHLRAHETVLDLVCRLLLENKKYNQ